MLMVYLKKISIIFTLIISAFAFGQFEFGAKAGINVSASGDITGLNSDFSSVTNIKENMTGYFIGSYISLDVLFLYLRPEIQFSYLNTNFDSLSLSQSRLEAPISLGFKLLPFLSVFSGPTLQYNFEPNIEDVTFSNIEKNTSIGIHMGLRVHLGPLNADIRFDRGITPNELVLIEQRGIPISGNVDTRDRLWSLGLSYKF
jgi:hypothetical protein